MPDSHYSHQHLLYRCSVLRRGTSQSGRDLPAHTSICHFARNHLLSVTCSVDGPGCQSPGLGLKLRTAVSSNLSDVRYCALSSTTHRHCRWLNQSVIAARVGFAWFHNCWEENQRFGVSLLLKGPSPTLPAQLTGRRWNANRRIVGLWRTFLRRGPADISSLLKVIADGPIIVLGA